MHRTRRNWARHPKGCVPKEKGRLDRGRRGAASAHPVTDRAVGSQGLAAVQNLQKPFVSASLLASYKTCYNCNKVAAVDSRT
jgi:hypothetical protein